MYALGSGDGSCLRRMSIGSGDGSDAEIDSRDGEEAEDSKPVASVASAAVVASPTSSYPLQERKHLDIVQSTLQL